MIKSVRLNQVYLGKMTISFSVGLKGAACNMCSFRNLCNKYFTPREVDILLSQVRMSSNEVFIFDCPDCIRIITEKFPEKFI